MAEADDTAVTFDLSDFYMEDPDSNEQVEVITLPANVVRAIEEDLMPPPPAEEAKVKKQQTPHNKKRIRHANKSNEQIDDISVSAHLPNTKNQTKWAIAIFKGNTFSKTSYNIYEILSKTCNQNTCLVQ